VGQKSSSLGLTVSATSEIGQCPGFKSCTNEDLDKLSDQGSLLSGKERVGSAGASGISRNRRRRRRPWPRRRNH